MRPTGPRSRTERARPAGPTPRPGNFPGRALALLVLLAVLGAASPAGAQEVFSWFNRDLLPVSFERGDWVRYAIVESDEYGSVTDTLTVTVVDADSAEVWLQLESLASLDFVALDPRRLEPGAELLSAILRVVRTTDTGLVDEDLDEMRESALVRRHFSDPFQQPEIHRVALPDTLVNGALLQRERVHLTEVRRETAGVFTIVTTLRAHAELSRDVPLLGLLRSWTLSEVATESARDEGGGRRRPPLVNENTLVCIDSGRLPDPTLPAGLNRTH